MTIMMAITTTTMTLMQTGQNEKAGAYSAANLAPRALWLDRISPSRIFGSF